MGSSTYIQDAVVVGNDRPHPALLLFLSEAAEELSQSVRDDRIWEVVGQANAKSPSHARIRQDMIQAFPPNQSTRLEKSSKGTVMRGRVTAEFVAEIEKLYAGPDNDGSSTQLERQPLESIISTITEIVSTRTRMQNEVAPDANLYYEGVDSSACVQIRNKIRTKLSPAVASRLRANVVYENGTIKGLATFIQSLSTSSSSPSAQQQTPQSQMRAMASQFVEQQPQLLQDLKPSGHVVLLTGSTGFLGTHILNQLLSSPHVSNIILPVRLNPGPPHAPTDTSAGLCRQRVESALRAQNLPPLTRPSAPKMTFFPAILHQPLLGLSSAQELRTLASTLTHVIHAAWAVNFNLPLATFEPNLAGVVNLYNLAELARKQQRGREVRYAFCSSVASVANMEGPVSWDQGDGAGDGSLATGVHTVPERVSDDPADASSFGYSQSKWVAERILADLGRDHSGSDASPTTKTSSSSSSSSSPTARMVFLHASGSPSSASANSAATQSTGSGTPARRGR